jgi:hypothetical protein
MEGDRSTREGPWTGVNLSDHIINAPDAAKVAGFRHPYKTCFRLPMVAKYMRLIRKQSLNSLTCHM